jgi:hypothetical protein
MDTVFKKPIVGALEALALSLLASAPAFAQQGVVMVMNEASGSQKMQARMQLDRTHVRTEIRDQGRLMAVTYDADAGVMRMIDDNGRTYTEITEADLKQMAGALAQLSSQLGNLPPEVVKQLGGRGIPGMPGRGAAPERITYKRTGTGAVGQWSCTTYDGFRGSEKVAEICAAESGVDLTAADFQVVQRLAEMMRSMNPQGAEQMAVYGTAESQGFAGFPVRRVTFRNGKPDSTSELAELRREAIPASVFAVPAGYKKQEMGLR